MDGSRIQEVTAQGLTYLDDRGEEQFIDFAACFQRWLGRSITPEVLKNVKEWNHMTDAQVQEFIGDMNNETVVGGRDIYGYSETKLPSIQFYTEPPTNFEFPDVQDFYRINYLVRKVGWRTQDLA